MSGSSAIASARRRRTAPAETVQQSNTSQNTSQNNSQRSVSFGRPASFESG